MANETVINDVVAREAMQQLEELDRAMVGTLQQFKDCASELAKGLKIPVEVTGDVERLKELTNTVMRDASQATQQLTQQLEQQQKVVANTTNTISRQLQAQENLNKAQREAFQQDRQAQQLAHEVLGARQQNYELLARYTAEMKANKDAQKQVNDQEKAGLITAEQAIQRRAALMAQYDRTKIAAQQLTRELAAETKEANAASGSYNQLSQRLERLKMAQKQLNEEERKSDRGVALEKEIQNLDAHLKDLAADMGEHQRNVGNYAIASQSLKSELKDLTNEIAQLTMEYNHLSSEEQRNDVGLALREKIAELTEKAGEYRDIIADVKQSINASASDTRWFDTMAESGQLMISTFQLAQSSCEALGWSEQSLQQSMLGVQRAMQAVQALQVIQNTLQKQSNLMKGIGIIQTKALAAAQKIEAAAAVSATGATKAQTIAQAAFNAVAKANPYVLLATAILGVVGLIVGYTAATNDATEADEAAKKATEERQESMENYYTSFGQNAGQAMVTYQALREGWNALGDDINAKRQYLIQHKDDFVSVANAANMNAASYANVTAVERNYMGNTSRVEAAIKRRARAMAALAEAIRLTQIMLQEMEKVSTARWSVMKAGNKVYASELKKYGIALTPEQQGRIAPPSPGEFGNSTDAAAAALAQHYATSGGKIELTGTQAIALTQAYKKAAIAAAQKAMKDVETKYMGMIDRVIHRGGANSMSELTAIANGPISGGGGSGGGGSRGSSGGGSGSGGSRGTTPAAKKAEEAKSEQELQQIILDIFTEANEKKVKVAEEFSDEWVKLMKQGIQDQKREEINAQEEKYNEYVKSLDLSLKQGKITREKYDELQYIADEAWAARGKAIIDAAAEEEKKIDEEVQKHKEELAHEELEKLQAKHNQELEELSNKNAIELNRLRNEYLQKLQLAEGNEEKIEAVKKKYAEATAKMELEQAVKSAKATVDLLEAQLAMENISAEDRAEISKKLADARLALNNAILDSTEHTLEAEIEAEKDAADKRKEMLEKQKTLVEKWIDTIADALSSVSAFMGAIYDNQIAKVEELIDAEQERYEKEINHIEWLAERGAITTEEAEIRKRDAEAAHAKQQEALEKKKASLEYKKAVIEKANNVSQTAIATAKGIMETYAQFGATPWGIALAAMVGAIGAVQIGTIMAQPIKAYAEGTKGKPHPGGLAIVGDAGKNELVMLGSRAWITPDSPTLVDLPRGAQVLPDVTKEDIMQMGAGLAFAMPRGKGGNSPVIINDYQALESRMANNTKAVTSELRAVRGTIRREMKRQKFNAYIAQRI